VQLEYDGVISTGEAPAVRPLAHAAVSYPVVFALDRADRADLVLANGNAALLSALHLSDTSPAEARKDFVVVDKEPPQKNGFAISQSNERDPDGGVGHPLINVSYSLEDRHPIRAWLYYTTSPLDQPTADQLVDPATHGIPSAGPVTGRLEVTASNPIVDRVYYSVGTTSPIANGSGPMNVGVQSAVLSSSHETIEVDCVFSTSGNYGFQMGFKRFGAALADSSTAGHFHSVSSPNFSPGGSGTAGAGPTNEQIAVNMRYVRSERKVYFEARRVSNNAVFVSGTASGTTWYADTVAQVRTFYGPVSIISFRVTTSPPPVVIRDPVVENTTYYLWMGARDHHNNRILYRPTPPSLYITPMDPVVVNYTFDVRDNFGRISAGASSPAVNLSLANTLDITFVAKDRGRGRLREVFFYYTTDGTAAPDANALAVLARAAATSQSGGRVWAVSGDQDSQSHVTAKLPEFSRVYLHVVAQDGKGNFSAVVRSDLHSALTPHGGTTYDCTIPTLASLAADLRAYDEVARDTKMEVEFAAQDSGGAGVAYLYVYYAAQDVALDPEQVRALAASKTPSDAEGGYVVDRRSPARPSSAATGKITTPDLARWTKFWVYATAEDGDGNLSREAASGKSHKVQMRGNFAYSGATGPADSRTWEYEYPVVTSLTVSLRTDNRVRVNYAASDAPSGLANVYLYYAKTDDPSITSAGVAALAASSVPSSSNGGRVWDLAASGYPSSSSTSGATEFLSPVLEQSQTYFFYATARDRQGNLTRAWSAPGSVTDVVTKRPIGIHGGLTYDLTHPVAAMTPIAEAYFTDVSPDVRQYVVNVDFSVPSPGDGGAALEKVYLYYTTEAGPFDSLRVVRDHQLSTTASSGKFTVSGATLSALGSYQMWYFHLVARDADSELVRTGSLNVAEGGTAAHQPPVFRAQIRAADNGRRTYDLNPPTIRFSV
jgi:hypothetical protein